MILHFYPLVREGDKSNKKIRNLELTTSNHHGNTINDGFVMDVLYIHIQLDTEMF